ncbi:MAG: putative metal-binding motif-containing protein, partial [Nitrospirota bacterium]
MKLGQKTLFFLICAVMVFLIGLAPSAYSQTCTDSDGDGYFVEGGACGPADCDDNNPNIKPGAAEICDGKDTNCDGWKPATDVDKDGDGVPLCASDCDDNNPLRFPGNTEVCDGIDNDCNYVVPANEKDNDGDGYRVCQGDCNDNNAAINPGVNESGTAMCTDNKDNDCDGLIDANDPP